MELNSALVPSFLENKSILITGAAGFLAKVFIEKVLRIQPNVKKLFLLVRAGDAASAQARLQTEVIQMDLFKILKEKYGGDFESFFWTKVTPVAGDIASKSLGVGNDNLKQLMWSTVDIIVNIAATTKFNERYDVALGINTLGVQHLLEFATRCTKLEKILHISTAYVAKEKTGLVPEEVLAPCKAIKSSSTLNIETEVKLVEEKLRELQRNKASTENINSFMKELGTKRANLFGWPNTYTFTKSMGEMLLGDLRKDLPVIILRPTMITSTYKDPFPGWIEGVRTTDLVIAGYGMGKLTFFPANTETILDVVPVDMVVNAMLTIVAASSRQHSTSIYHVGSSVRNPLNIRTIQDVACRYFKMNPFIKENGRQVKVVRLFCFPTMASFFTYMALRNKLPLQFLGLFGALICSRNLQNKYKRLNRKYKHMITFAKAYEPFTLYQRSFNDGNLGKLRAAMEKDKEALSFDTKCINWDHYLMHVHIPGLLKYGMKKN